MVSAGSCPPTFGPGFDHHYDLTRALLLIWLLCLEPGQDCEYDFP
jgi:hypothetical protein